MAEAKTTYKKCPCGARMNSNYTLCSTCRSIKEHERRYEERKQAGKILTAVFVGANGIRPKIQD